MMYKVVFLCLNCKNTWGDRYLTISDALAEAREMGCPHKCLKDWEIGTIAIIDHSYICNVPLTEES